MHDERTNIRWKPGSNGSSLNGANRKAEVVIPMHQPLAYVHPGARIAQNVVIEPFVTIHNNVEIDEGTWIGAHVTIMEGARIGKNCRIFPGAVISAIPQDLKFKNEDTLAIIGNNVTIREYVTVNRGTRDKHKTVIGDNT